MSANIVESIGYTVERIHSGLLAHLFKSDRDKDRQCGREVLAALGIDPMPTDIVGAVHEWKNIDLVLIASDGTPRVAFEFKVDSPEGRVRGKPQMKAYRDRLDDIRPDVPLLYVTLGLSQVYEKPEGKHYEWICLDRFLKAVKCLRPSDGVYADWVEALESERDRRKEVENGRPRATTLDFRPGAWNIYLMASFRKELIENEQSRLWQGSSLYVWGQKPDTIWHLGSLRDPYEHLYAEINSNGKLNLKIGFPQDQDPSLNEKAFEAAQLALKALLSGFEVEQNSRAGFKNKTKSLLSVDVGLSVVEDGRFAFSESRDQVLRRLRAVALAIFPHN